MTALVRPPCTTELNDGLCVSPCFAVPRSIIRYQRAKCSSAIPRARATCTAHVYSTGQSSRPRHRPRPVQHMSTQQSKAKGVVIIIRAYFALKLKLKGIIPEVRGKRSVTRVRNINKRPDADVKKHKTRTGPGMWQCWFRKCIGGPL